MNKPLTRYKGTEPHLQRRAWIFWTLQTEVGANKNTLFKKKKWTEGENRKPRRGKKNKPCQETRTAHKKHEQARSEKCIRQLEKL